ncbi:MAG: class I SAM-dependent methyltransferase [Gemmatimonas sp.]
MADSTTRFSSRVENYVKYRPGYPPGVVELLRSDCGLTSDSVIADVGSGTGILSELFLKNGNAVIGVEPNAPMRHAAEKLLATHMRFQSIDGTAEHTGLSAASVNFVTAGQAFHWFDRNEARREFKRILKPSGWVMLVWNERTTAQSAFGDAYEQLLMEYATEYEIVNQRSMSANSLAEFFAGEYVVRTLPNAQHFDFDGLKGRLLSSSYAPESGHPKHEPMLAALRELFNTLQVNGEVVFAYDTNVYYGRL